MSDLSIAIIVPVLRRPQRVALLMRNVRTNTTVSHRLLFVASPDDEGELSALQQRGADHIVVDQPPGPGDYARKINAGYRATTEAFVFTGADDLDFHPGWDTAALARFSDGVGVMGTNDLCNQAVLRGEHSTHSLVSRAYADEHGTIDGPGAIYAECYPHEWVDNELVETAKARGAFAFAADSVVEHLHPNCGKGDDDELYAGMTTRMQQGRRVFQQRRRRWKNLTASKAPVSVVVATFGEQRWADLAAQRAVPSVRAQRMPAAEVIVVHGDTLAAARNEGAQRASQPWLCFLDADDELGPAYFAAMLKHTRKPGAGLLNPSVRFVMPDGRMKPSRVFKPIPLDEGNYLVIGTLVRRDLFFEAGGFDERWEAWEDWQVWRKVEALGGRIVQVPQAIYKAHWRADGRNNTIADRVGLRRRMVAEFNEWRRMRGLA